MKLISDPMEFKAWRWQNSQHLGFVPTMGALHQGHEELLKKARAENELLALSIFVNPTQFNDPNDFAKYPQTWDADLEIADRNKVDVVFAPTKDAVYPDNYRYKVVETEFSKSLCGKDRPGHFDGVLSIVMKLFHIVRPEKAYFGEKDFQQLQLIKDMVKAFFMDVEIVAVPTVREASGLALSSRNTRLTEAERTQLAPQIFQVLRQAESSASAHERLTELGFQVDYVTDIQGRRFVAAKLGEVRLIDNVPL